MRFLPLLVSILLLLTLWSDRGYAEDGNPELKVGIAGRPLFQYVDHNGQFAGLDVELSKLIFTEAGFDIRYYYYPWTRILRLIEQGELDVGLSAADSDERKAYAYFSQETFRLGQNLLFTSLPHAAKFSEIKKLEQLNGLEFRLAVLRGAAYSGEYERLKAQAWFAEKLVVVDSPKRTLDMLVRGRVEAFLGSEYGVQLWAREIGYQGQLVPVFPLMTSLEAETHIMYSKKSVPLEWVGRIDKAMKDLKLSGEYQRRIDSILDTEALSPEANN